MPAKKEASQQKYTEKTVYSLASPLPDPAWPIVETGAQETIVDLLCQLINSIGEHRRKHIQPSRGKRDRKRRRSEIESAGREISTAVKPSTAPPEPEILHSLTIGYNSTHRALEAIVQRAPTEQEDPHRDAETSGSLEAISTRQLAAVFVDRSVQPKIMYGHLPLLVSATQHHLDEESAVRLVPLPNGAGEKISTALHVPRVGILGVYQDTAGANPLLAFVRDNVSAIDPSWLRSPVGGEYLPVKINVATTKAPVQPSKSVRRQQARAKEEAAGKPSEPSS